MLREIDRYYFEKEEPVQGCLLALRSIILEHDPDISETRKWNMPCFTYRNKMFCFLWTMKKTEEPYILWVEGNYLKNKYLEKGDRSRMKILRIKPDKDIPVKIVRSLLEDTLNLYRNGNI